MAFFLEEIKPKIANTMKPFPAGDPARTCLENNMLIYLVEYCKDLKRKNMIKEGSDVTREATNMLTHLRKQGAECQ